MALALTLLAGGGLALHSFWNMLRVDLGVRVDHILTFYLPVPDNHLASADQIVAFYQQLEERVAALPGVSSVSVSEGLPVQGVFFTMRFSVEGKPVDDPAQLPDVDFNMVTPGYFRAFGVQIDRGRALENSDRTTGVRVAVVNEMFVKKYFARSRSADAAADVSGNGPGRGQTRRACAVANRRRVPRHPQS